MSDNTCIVQTETENIIYVNDQDIFNNIELELIEFSEKELLELMPDLLTAEDIEMLKNMQMSDVERAEIEEELIQQNMDIQYIQAFTGNKEIKMIKAREFLQQKYA